MSITSLPSQQTAKDAANKHGVQCSLAVQTLSVQIRPGQSVAPLCHCHYIHHIDHKGWGQSSIYQSPQ